jgi:hypothetical protein
MFVYNEDNACHTRRGHLLSARWLGWNVRNRYLAADRLHLHAREDREFFASLSKLSRPSRMQMCWCRRAQGTRETRHSCPVQVVFHQMIFSCRCTECVPFIGSGGRRRRRRAEGRAVEEEVVGEEVSERVRIIGWSWMSLSSSLRKAGHCQSFVRLFSRPGTTPKAEVESIMEPGPGLSHRATRQSNSKRGRSRWRGEERSEVVGGGRMNRMGRGGEHWQAIGSDRLPFDLVGSAKRLLRSPS